MEEEDYNNKINEVIKCFIGLSFDDARKIVNELNENFVNNIPDYIEVINSAVDADRV